jgi:hypothetical protein
VFERRVVELLRAAAEPVAPQPGDQQVQPLDLSQGCAQDGLQGSRILGQVCGGGEHALDAESSLRIAPNESGVSS